MKETIIILLAWIFSIVLLLVTIPRDKIREAQVAFLFKQMLTWFFGLLVVEFGLIEYPVTLFKTATKTQFSFEYFVYPAICATFNVRYPVQAGFLGKFLYYSLFCSGITIVEVLCEKYTDIIKYIHWTWWLSWITLFTTFYLSRKYYVWFFKLKKDSVGSDSD